MLRYVFLHGSPGDAGVWSAVLALRPPDAVCLPLDLPDHGAATDELEGRHAALEARVVARLAELDGQLVLVGHSYGAYLCARLAPRLAGRLARLVLVSGLPGLPPENAQAFQAMAQQLESGELTASELERRVAHAWYGPDVTRDERHFVAELLTRTGTARRGRVLARLAQLAEPQLRVAPYATPAVALHGEHDAAVSLELGQQLCALGSRARLETLSTASHMLPLTHAAQVALTVFR